MYILLGLACGIAIGYLLIFPTDILNLSLATLTLADVVRILGGVGVAALVTWAGVVVRRQIG